MATASPFFISRFLSLFFYSFFLLFFSFSHFSSHFSFFFSFIFSPFPHFSLNFSPPFWSIDRMDQKEEVSSPPSSSQMGGFPFSFFFFYFIILFMTSYSTWLNMSHGIMPPMWLNVSHSFYAKCHTLKVSCGIPLPCHVSSNTPRLEKLEIPTTSESNEIRRGS